MNLQDYILQFSTRNACQCGLCIDKETIDLSNQHTVNNGFFDVAVKNDPNKDQFIEAVKNHKGYFNEVDLFDKQEHGYMELGGWVGDQGLALQMMALGSLLGVWTLLTPKIIFGDAIPDDQAQQMAGMGMVTVIAQ